MKDGQDPDFLTRSANFKNICLNAQQKTTRRYCQIAVRRTEDPGLYSSQLLWAGFCPPEFKCQKTDVKCQLVIKAPSTTGERNRHPKRLFGDKWDEQCFEGASVSSLTTKRAGAVTSGLARLTETNPAPCSLNVKKRCLFCSDYHMAQNNQFLQKI